ncbi:MAG: UDP-3-O-acyl-N-acetylglucosamine deacetylase [Pirellulaceae bacterium]|nr:UDP-3-O-acyl-N-acetylglucosamine deacetylase [Pirellulaceae bacterium]
MRFKRLQQTLASVAHVSGRGYWSGQPVTVSFEPAPANTGIIFKRTDLPGKPTLAAMAQNRVETSLRTRLASGDCSFDMVEHVLAALYAMEIDNCVVQCSANEMPGLDGSALAFALAIERAGLDTQNDTCRTVCIEAPFKIGDDRQWIMALPSAEPGLCCEYRLDYGDNPIIPAATFRAKLSPRLFIDEIAPARTFVTDDEAKNLQNRGVASHVTHRDLLVFGPDGPIDNVLRYEDECARHKLLDLVGDLALSGVALQGKIVAFRSGHILNGKMAQWVCHQKALYRGQRSAWIRKIA